MIDKKDQPDFIEAVQATSFTRGCFLLLSVGTLPVLFMNPLDYLFTLGVCYIITRGLARILF